jgi:DMSO reductase anchor subunit
MHPAFSVVLLTTLIGVGQGLFLALYVIETRVTLGVLSPGPQASFYAVGSAIAIGFIAAGLLASFFHLGRPERAWRAAAMWRTSWLSREVIVLPLFGALVATYGLAHYVGRDYTIVIGGIAAVAGVMLFVCTGMIYACIKFLQEWSTPLTVVNFTLLGCASGISFAAVYAALAYTPYASEISVWAAAFTLAAFLTRTTSLIRNARLKPRSSLQTALGIKHPRIIQKSQGFTGASFNTREFFHGVGAASMRAAKWTFIVLVFPLPVLLLMAGAYLTSAPLLVAAFVVQFCGLIIERWFFFAQANHPQNLYYQAIS